MIEFLAGTAVGMWFAAVLVYFKERRAADSPLTCGFEYQDNSNGVKQIKDLNTGCILTRQELLSWCMFMARCVSPEFEKAVQREVFAECERNPYRVASSNQEENRGQSC